MYNYIKIIALTGLLVALGGLHVYDKQKAVAEAVKSTYLAYELANEKVKVKAKEEAKILLIAQQREKDAKDKTIVQLSVERDAAIRMLNDRASRPKQSGDTLVVGAACTGRELYKEDGEFLTREAFRAQEVVVERDYYYEQYNLIREMIRKINDGN
jgi:hypothetical protein